MSRLILILSAMTLILGILSIYLYTSKKVDIAVLNQDNKINKKSMDTSNEIKEYNKDVSNRLDSSSDGDLDRMLLEYQTEGSSKTVMHTMESDTTYLEGQGVYGKDEQTDEKTILEESQEYDSLPESMCDGLIWDTTLGWIPNCRD